MKRALIVAAVALPLSLIAACGNDAQPGSPSASSSASAEAAPVEPERPEDAGELAEAMQEQIGEVERVLVYTENNDPNDLLGRPNGYDSAVLLFDNRAECLDESPGIDCGAVIEIWSDETAARDRADSIQEILSAGGLGSEYDYVEGNQLLRVSGAIKPSEAEAYERAWADIG